MPSKVPPLEETKAIILKAKGAAWLEDAQKKFKTSYGGSVNDPNMAMWLIGKQAGLDVTEIKATSEAAEGEEVVISQIVEKAKNPADNGWTLVNGGKFEQPDSQDKYCLPAVVVLNVEEGETSTKKPKLDLVLADATGIAKCVAYADAVDLFVQAKAGCGSVLKIPLVNVQYGHHNFTKVKDAVWWKFAVPPFGEVVALDNDPKEFFVNYDMEPAKENKPTYLLGFVTHVEPRTQEICNVCDRWVLEKKQQDHDKCRKQAEEQEIEYGTHEETTFNGTATSINGQTVKLIFEAKPKVKIAIDLLEIYGRTTKNGAIDVAFIRKPGTAGIMASAPAEAPTAIAKKVAKAAPSPVEPETEEEAAPEPPKAVVKAKKAPVAPPPVEETEEEEQEAPTPVVTIKAATKMPVAAKAPVAPAKPKAAPAENGEALPPAILSFIENECKSFGGSMRIFVLSRKAVKNGLMADGDAETVKAAMTAYCASAVAGGHCEWTSPEKIGVKWTA